MALRLMLVALSIAVLSSCSFRSAVQPSVLVILVENLGFGSFSCGEAEGTEYESGFQAFCEEAVRFTHTYTTSTMSQAAIASVLTAQYPYQHGVRHNGFQALSSKSETVAEVALAHHYKTSFFSGGPPIWRKSGFQQGIEVFDDNISVASNRLYRPAHELVDLFLNWQETEAPKGRYLSFLYLADLQFIDALTTNDIGELRESSYRSQISEVGESLETLVRTLKARKIWDNTDIFLVGLNGYPPEGRDDEAPGTNLFSERTRVSLMIKPSRKKRDGPFNWKIDSSVSLVDVGSTLFDLIGAPRSASRTAPEIISLRSALQGPEPDWQDERLILIESAWAQWRGLGEIRASLRKGSYLYVYDENPLLFDTLTDSLEISPLPHADRRYDVLRAELSGFLERVPYQKWRPLDRSQVEKLDVARMLWRNRVPDLDTRNYLRALSKRFTEDAQLLGWRALWALRLDDWSELRAAAGKDRFSLWSYVAARNLGTKLDAPADPCFGFLKAGLKNWSVPKECSSEGFHELMRWADESLEQSERDKSMEAFLRIYAIRSLATRIAEQNYLGGLSWDTPLAYLQGPDAVDLVLALPEMRRYRTIIKRRVSL